MRASTSFEPRRRGAARTACLDPAGVGLRALVAWVAIFGLYLQLAALCPAGPPLGGSDGIGASPICHVQLDAGRTDGSDGQDHPDRPAHGACPFCALHGHVAVASPSPEPVRPIGVAAAAGHPPAFAASPLSRRPTDARPRGPPIAV